jgi:hypothetical protein
MSERQVMSKECKKCNEFYKKYALKELEKGVSLENYQALMSAGDRSKYSGDEYDINIPSCMFAMDCDRVNCLIVNKHESVKIINNRDRNLDIILDSGYIIAKLRGYDGNTVIAEHIMNETVTIKTLGSKSKAKVIRTFNDADDCIIDDSVIVNAIKERMISYDANTLILHYGVGDIKECHYDILEWMDGPYHLSKQIQEKVLTRKK